MNKSSQYGCGVIMLIISIIAFLLAIFIGNIVIAAIAIVALIVIVIALVSSRKRKL